MTDDRTPNPIPDGPPDREGRPDLSDDALMAQLRRADPVHVADLPAADDPAPRHLLETLMSASTDPSRSVPPATAVDAGAAPADGTPVHPAMALAERRGNRRRWGFLVASAAAVLFLVVGVLAFAPNGAEPALATVHSAAAATAEVDTGRIAVTATADGTDGQESGRFMGRVDAVFAGEDFSATVEIDEAPDDAGFEQFPVTESRLVDGTVYLFDGVQWYSVEAPEFLGQSLQEIVDPRSVLGTVQELAETEELGPVTVDGVATTHYRSVVDLQDESLGQAGWLAVRGADVEAEGEVQIDLFVDGDGLIRQLDVSGDVQEPEGGPGSATFEVSTTFSDLGADLTVEAPAAATPIDPLVESFLEE